MLDASATLKLGEPAAGVDVEAGAGAWTEAEVVFEDGAALRAARTAEAALGRMLRAEEGEVERKEGKPMPGGREGQQEGAKEVGGAAAGAAGHDGKPPSAGGPAGAAPECGEPPDASSRLTLRLSYRFVAHWEAGAGAPRAAQQEEEADAAAGVLPLFGGQGLPEVELSNLPRHLHSYGHGAFMGAALSLLADKQWVEILRREDPKTFAAALRAAAKLVQWKRDVLKPQGPDRPVVITKLFTGTRGRLLPGCPRRLALMPVLENCPVLAAYGTVRSGSAQPCIRMEAAAARPVPVIAAEAAGSEDASAQLAPAPGAAAAKGQGNASSSASTADHSAAAQHSSAAPSVSAATKQESQGPPASAPSEGDATAEVPLEAPHVQVMSPAPEEPESAAGPQGPAPAGRAPNSSAPGVAAATEGPEKAAADVPAGFGKGSARLQAYLESLAAPNRYGYLPIAHEWDIWLSPTDPADLAAATVSHGSATALVVQALTSATACTRGCARSAGSSQIAREGMSPPGWLSALGHSVNAAINGDRGAPLALAAPAEANWRLRVAAARVTGVPQSWGRVYVRGSVASERVALPVRRRAPMAGAMSGAAQRSSGPGGTDGVLAWEGGSNPLEFWPLPLDLAEETLCLQLRGDPVGPVADRGISAVARLPLARLVRDHPQLLEQRQAELHLVLEARGKGAAAAVASMDDEEGEEEGGARALALAQAPVPSPARGAGRGGGPASPQRVCMLATGGDGGADAAVATGEVRLTLVLEVQEVGALTALQELGVPPAAAQTCLALLSAPGGLFLDIKSAYSTAHDLQLFPRQLAVPPTIAHTVLFYHGLSGLENACDTGRVAEGTFVLFNGASFLLDPRPGAALSLPDEKVAGLLSAAERRPLDKLAVSKYKGLVEQYRFAGGVYLQEPDAAASSVDAIVRLVTQAEAYFPLGFCYGHVAGAGVSILDLGGRGFASQELLEELAARSDLSARASEGQCSKPGGLRCHDPTTSCTPVVRKVAAGEHRAPSFSANTATAWVDRLISGSTLLSLREQRALLALLAGLPARELPGVVDRLGGVPRICLRFFQHYEARFWTPMTILEAGFNANKQKSFLRLLRDRGALAALPLRPGKLDLAAFFAGPSLRGYGLTYLAMALRLRVGLHKHAKEGLLCLLESCTAEEREAVVAALGGAPAVARRLCGWLRLSWHYSRRLADVEAVHREDPSQLAYLKQARRAGCSRGLKYAALPSRLEDGGGTGDMHDVLHTRDKTRRKKLWQLVRKTGCCAYSCGCTFLLEILTLGLFVPCCVCPRVCGAGIKGTCGVPAVLAMVLGFLCAIGLYVAIAALARTHKLDP
eukprot:scaffold4.g4784.t1